MADLKNALLSVADRIRQILESSSFPDGIEPLFLRDAVRAYPLRGGKRIRPALLLWSCGMFGGNIAEALPAAAAVEVYHNWTLVHDDIIDRDDFRRGLPTTHAALSSFAADAYAASPEAAAKFGTDFAILAGDLQQAWAFELMLGLVDTGVNPALVTALAREMQNFLGRGLISGEALDVEFEYRKNNGVTSNDVSHMISGKTGALLRFSTVCGGAIALGTSDFSRPELKNAAGFAENFAFAFQLQDDYLGVFGDVKKFGKPLGSDFQESKPTLLYLEALKRTSPAGKKRLLELTGLAVYTETEMAEIRSILTDSGAAAFLRSEIGRASEESLQCLSLLPGNEYRDLLESLVRKLTDRTV